jgi:hypothetical protein
VHNAALSEYVVRNRRVTRALFLLALIFGVSGSSVAAESAPLPGISATGKVSAHLSVVSDLVPFTFTFHNATGNKLDNLLIANVPAGYTLHDLCVNTEQSCKTEKELQARPEEISKTVPAGGSLVVWGNFRASPPHKPQTLFLVLTWGIEVAPTEGPSKKNPRARKETAENQANKSGAPSTNKTTNVYSSLAVDMGDNEVQSKGWAWVTDYSSILILPLAIPVVLAGLTYLFNVFGSWSARRAEIWKQMLPAIHGYSTKFYMPMSMAADALAGELKDSNPDVAFFFFLLLLRIYLDSTAEIGGFYFKDHRGENVANKCWYGIWNAFFPDGRKSAIYVPAYAAAELVDPQFTYEDFARRYLVGSGAQISFANFDIQECWGLFCKHIPQTQPGGEPSKAFDDLTLLLQAFSTTLDCEVNRPYKYWYPALVPVRVKAKVLELLQEMAREAKINWWQRFTYFRGWKVDDGE